MRAVAAFEAGATQHAVQSDGAQRAQHSRYGAVRQAAAHDDRLSVGGDRCAALEQGAQPFDELGRPIGQVGEGAFFDLAGVAIALAQEDRGRRCAIGDRFDIHGFMIPQSRHYQKHISTYLHGYIIRRENGASCVKSMT